MSKSLTEQQLVDEHPHLFRRLHLHDGVWWSEVFPGFSRPAFQFRAVVPKEARPERRHSLLGYRHRVPEIAMGNQVMDYMVLEGDDLRKFDMNRLSSNTRNHVRKGFRRCKIREITELEPLLEEARHVCVSHSARLSKYRASYHVHHTFFINQAETWRAQVRRDFRSRGRTWWGAFSEGRLVGYVVMLHVEDMMILDKMKVHADGLPLHASDALYFTALEHASRDEYCQCIFNSSPQRSGLDRFKEHYLFKPTPIPFYVSNIYFYSFAQRAAAFREKFLTGRTAHQKNERYSRNGAGVPSAKAISPDHSGSEL